MPTPQTLPLTGAAPGNGDAHHGAHKHHVTSPILLLSVYGVLLTLTVLTVGVTLVDMGELNIWVALAIAVVKAGVVAMYFMHLRWDNPFNGAILIMSLVFVAVFIGVAIMDSHNYQHFYVAPGPGQAP